MDSSKPNSEEGGPFYDASDDFPFYDCVDFDQPEQRSPAPSATLRRRRRSRDSKHNEGHLTRLSSDLDRPGSARAAATPSGDEKNESSMTKTANSELVLDTLESASSVRAGTPDVQTNGGSVITEADGEPVGESFDSMRAPGDAEALSSSMLISLVELMIKAIGFQINLIVSMVTFPFCCLYTFVMFIMDPFSTMRRGRNYIIGKLLNLWNLIWECASPFLYQWLKEHDSVWKLMLRFGWGLFWAIYVCSILFGLLVTATLISGFIMRYLVKEPLRIEDKLNFDYTKHHPVAYVPLVSCAGIDCGAEYKELAQISGSQQLRFILPNNKLEATVTLALPESEYNKNLGIFQIRVDFLSSTGETLASSSRPCMLLFKSEPIRLMLTMLKIAPLIAGYISESQTIKVKFQGFVEGNVPTSCLRVLVEQRAEFRPRAGIPEIYDAKLILESELSLLKRLLWSWRKTVFVWTVMLFFTVQLLFALICCRPVILPRTKWRNGLSGNNAT
ncbi:seipin-2-like [Punica granatum]|uniref:Seipin-2-like n=1 Tax=Punica granatum TaxID=22663 RepID=A0A6P8ECC7_PUNGR|nr:seipin-2-like [Punica granatum]